MLSCISLDRDRSSAGEGHADVCVVASPFRPTYHTTWHHLLSRLSLSGPPQVHFPDSSVQHAQPGVADPGAALAVSTHELVGWVMPRYLLPACLACTSLGKARVQLPRGNPRCISEQRSTAVCLLSNGCPASYPRQCLDLCLPLSLPAEAC